MIRLLSLCAGVIIFLSVCLFAVFAAAGPSERPNSEKINADTGRSQIYKKETILSEDGVFTAIVQDGEDLWSTNVFSYDARYFSEVWVGKTSVDHSEFKLAFSGWNRVDAYWSGKNHLVIRLGLQTIPPTIPPVIPSKPAVMLRDAGGVHISYQSTDELSEHLYRERLQEYEQNQRSDLNSYVRQSTPDQAWAWMQELWGRYLAFRNWLPPRDDDPSSSSPTLNTDLDMDVTFASPGGEHVAILATSHKAEMPEGTASYAVRIARRDDPRDGGDLVFYALDGRPDLTWNTPTSLLITIAYLSRVRVSLHKMDGIEVTYRLTEPMSAAGFHERLEHQKHFLEQTSPQFKPPPPEEQRELSARLDSNVQQQLERYAVFQQWAKDNIGGSDH